MRIKKIILFTIAAILMTVIHRVPADTQESDISRDAHTIVTSDTILSGMIAEILPAPRYTVEAILPPGQCPGHYDVKLSDIRKITKADLLITFRGMPFPDKSFLGDKKQLLVEAGKRNWMAPDTYVHGLNTLADDLAKYFPQDAHEISIRKDAAILKVKAEANHLRNKIRQAGVSGRPVIASAMQKEPLEWMGVRVVAEYGRPEAISAKELVNLFKIGRDLHVIAVVDNLQTGPDTGKGLAESLKVPHVVLTNFPSHGGYLATLEENVEALLTAVIRK